MLTEAVREYVDFLADHFLRRVAVIVFNGYIFSVCISAHLLWKSLLLLCSNDLVVLQSTEKLWGPHVQFIWHVANLPSLSISYFVYCLYCQCALISLSLPLLPTNHWTCRPTRNQNAHTRRWPKHASPSAPPLSLRTRHAPWESRASQVTIASLGILTTWSALTNAVSLRSSRCWSRLIQYSK